jgi:DNA modification methylase
VTEIRDRIVELVRVRAGELTPNPRNWRRHPARQRSALLGVLEQVGYADALLARRVGDELVLIDGHLRQSLDPDQVVPVLVLDLDGSEADLLLTTLDPLASLAVPDPQALADLLAVMEASSEDVQALLDEIAGDIRLPRELLTDPDEIPAVVEPRTRRGDVWALGDHRLACGDAREPSDLARLMDGQTADVLWTDPPYGVGYVGKTTRAMRISGDGTEGLAELLARSFDAVGSVLAPGAAIYLAHPAGPNALVFLEAFRGAGWRLHQGLVWVKDTLVLGHGDYHYRHEPIAFGYAPGGGRRGRGHAGWYGGDAQTSVLEVPRPAASREHPTMKPVELIRLCLENSSPHDARVLDPFSGSGSTIVACELTGRRGYGLELDPAYCDVAIARWEAATGSEAHLDGSDVGGSS